MTICVAVLLLQSMFGAAPAHGQQDDRAIAAYADAANFQTGGAIDLAIQAWTSFVNEFPEHQLVPEAHHYLGVCQMQAEEPDLVAAAKSFQQALRTKQFKLREESLANLGWCLFAATGDQQPRDQARLRQSVETFQTLLGEFPDSRFKDRAIFFTGEAAFALGDSETAVERYNELLALPNAKDSPLRCDALYARGVAQEQLDRPDDAIATYQQFIDGCSSNELIADVQLRIGDILINRKEFESAISTFQSAFDSTESSADRSYALFRQAYALVQIDRLGEAAGKYEQLLADYPESQYAAAALLASAQSAYRIGDLDKATTGFRRVLDGDDIVAATEAAHWLARIEIGKSRFDSAERVIRKQLERGTEGRYAAELRLDLAESLATDPETAAEAMNMYVSVYREAPDAEAAPRALYNASFSALQLNRRDQAFELATGFLQQFPDDPLRFDVEFIAAECLLLDQQLNDAIDRYQALLRSAPGNAPQRPLWVLRTAIALTAAQRYDDAVNLIDEQFDSLVTAEQQAEASYLMGRAHLMAGRATDATKAFQKSLQTTEEWPGSLQTWLELGQAQLAAEDTPSAIAAWSKVIERAPDSPIANRARYQLAQLESGRGNHDRAIALYQQMLAGAASDQLRPHALYGKGWSLMQTADHQAAADTLHELIQQHQAHPLVGDALLARGICLRNLDQFDAAKADLESALNAASSNTNLGHALYELALIDQRNKDPRQAATRLQRLVAEVPDYPAMDKVLYELGWSLQETGESEEAIEFFERLIASFPAASLATDAAYYVGQQRYAAGQWSPAAEKFALAANSDDPALAEKSLYRLGWSHFKQGKFSDAEAAFANQSNRYPDGPLAFDAIAMIGECRFKRADYDSALAGYSVAREWIRKSDETAATLRDPASRRVRELALLHGGQSAAQLKQWEAAIEWHDEHRQRFPSSDYLPQVFYETGFAYHQSGNTEEALKHYRQVAEKYRNEVAARARFMMGEIYFGNRELDKAIPEFQRVMFGFGAEKAAPEIKNWQAKSGFEAARCSEVLMQSAKTDKSKAKALQYATNFYTYVLDKHAEHELASKARLALEALAQ